MTLPLMELLDKSFLSVRYNQTRSQKCTKRRLVEGYAKLQQSFVSHSSTRQLSGEESDSKRGSPVLIGRGASDLFGQFTRCSKARCVPRKFTFCRSLFPFSSHLYICPLGLSRASDSLLESDSDATRRSVDDWGMIVACCIRMTRRPEICLCIEILQAHWALGCL